MNFVYLKWIDSSVSGGWQTVPNDNTGTSECETAGILVHEDRQHIQVALSTSENGHYGEILSIPKKVIVVRHAMGFKKERK